MAGSSGEFWQVFLPDRLVGCFCPWMLLSLLARVCVKCVCVCVRVCVCRVCACVRACACYLKHVRAEVSSRYTVATQSGLWAFGVLYVSCLVFFLLTYLTYLTYLPYLTYVLTYLFFPYLPFPYLIYLTTYLPTYLPTYFACLLAYSLTYLLTTSSSSSPSPPSSSPSSSASSSPPPPSSSSSQASQASWPSSYHHSSPRTTCTSLTYRIIIQIDLRNFLHHLHPIVVIITRIMTQHASFCWKPVNNKKKQMKTKTKNNKQNKKQ